MSANDSIIIVTGLPRSGTSLMMQILQAGGVTLLTDNCRPPDVSNPRGYFEYEKVKWLPADSSWLGLASGKAIKVIAQLTPFLPKRFQYRVVFMERDLNEVLKSQSTMMGTEFQTSNLQCELRSAFEKQIQLAREYLTSLPHSNLTVIDHQSLLSAPAAAIDRVCQLIDQPNLDIAAMIAAIEQGLYRSRIHQSATQS